MLKRWQEHCSVPLRSFVLELLAVDFLEGWEHAGKSTVYYDWMTRDFFRWLKDKWFLPGVTVPGTDEFIALSGEEWKSKAQSAYGRAVKACDYEQREMPYSAGEEWQKVFGDFIPVG